MTDSPQITHTLRKWMNIFTHHSMHDSARFVKSRGFSMPQFFLLMQVYRREHCGISDLSEHLEITSAAVSQLVDKLVQAGWLIRSEDPNDRRAKKVELSPEGKALIEEGIEERYRWVDTLADVLSEEEEEKISEALDILDKTMKRVENKNQ